MKLALVDKPRGAGERPTVWTRPTLTCLRHYTCQGGRNAETLPRVSNLVGGKTAKAALKNIQFQ